MDPPDISQTKRSYVSLPKLSSTRDSAHGSRRHLPSLRDHHHLNKSHTSHSRHHSTKEKPSSAIDLHTPVFFSELARSVNRSIEQHSTPTSTETGSRRGSVQRIEEGEPHGERGVSGSGSGSGHGGAGAFIGPRPVLVRPEDVAKEHVKNQVREEELRATISSLTGLALGTTRQLDDTYYSILEHIANLRTTIGGLQELSDLAKQLKKNFDEDADELETDIRGQIEALAGFSGAKGKIAEFEQRVERSRAEARSLSERLEIARRKVEERERLEEEWQARASRRLQILWGVLGGIVGLFVLLLLFHYFRTQPGVAGVSTSRKNFSFTMSTGSVPPSVREMLDSLHESPKSSRAWSTAKETREEERDPRLRLLDEL